MSAGEPCPQGPPRGDDEGPCAVVLRACEKGFCEDDMKPPLLGVYSDILWGFARVSWSMSEGDEEGEFGDSIR